MQKTNALRQLDKAKIKYETKEYEVDESDLSGLHLALTIGENPDDIYKTLVTVSASKNYYVFCLPCDKELDLKKCAKVAGEKNVEMIPVKQLLPLTGYIRGGCSPVGMKKQFKTFFYYKAKEKEYVYMSAGVRGLQMKVNPDEVLNFIKGTYEDFIKE